MWFDTGDAATESPFRASESSAMTRQQICERCGRKGSRGFVIVAGKGLRYGGDEQIVCANRSACDKRLAVAERNEGWSLGP